MNVTEEVKREDIKEALTADHGYVYKQKFRRGKNRIKNITREELGIKVEEYLKGGGEITYLKPMTEEPSNYFSLL